MHLFVKKVGINNIYYLQVLGTAHVSVNNFGISVTAKNF